MRQIRFTLAVFAFSTVGVAAPLTVAQSMQIRTPSNLEFSADGKLLALQVREPVKGLTAPVHVWVLNAATSEMRQFTHSTKSESNPRWSPDGRFLAFLSDREERNQIYLMRLDGGEAQKLTEGKNAIENFSWSPDGKQIAFLAAEPKSDEVEKKERDKEDARVVDRDETPARLWVVDLESRKARQVSKSPWRIEEIAWLSGGQSLFVKATDHPESDQWKDSFAKINLASGEVTTVFKPRGPFGRMQVSRDGTEAAWVASANDGPAEHDLFRQKIDGSGTARNVTGAQLDRPVMQFRWRSGHSIVALVQNGFRSEVREIRESGMERLFAEFPLSPSDLAISTTNAIALVASNSVTLPEVWLSTNGSAPIQVSRFNQGWKDTALHPVELVHYPSFDQQQIEAALIRPSADRANGKLPLVVLIHGGPTGLWADRFASWAQLLAERGYLVLSPNIRGSVGYGQKFIEANRADWGGADFKDVMAGVDWLIARGDADPQRVGIGGWSYGGYMSMWAVTQTNRFKAAVAGAGMSDLATEYGTEQGAAYDEWFYGLPYERPEGFRNSSPINYVKNARTPTLILQGEADKTDPISQSQMFYRALKRYGVKSDFVVYPREGHGIREEKHAADVLERMLAWFDTYLKP